MIWIVAPHGQLYKMLLLDKLVVHFENIRRLPWNGGLLCMQRWLSTWASIQKILTPQASYLLLLLWGKWLWLFGTCSNLEGTCKHKQMMCCAVLSWCKYSRVAETTMVNLAYDCHQYQCHLQHHAHIGAHLQDVTYIMMHIYGIAAGQWDLILRGSRQRGFRLGRHYQGFLFPTSSMPNRATFARSSLLLPTWPMRRSSTSVQHNGDDSAHLNQSQCH